MVARAVQQRITPKGADKCRRKFLRFFPKGFRDETYIAWERGYKWRAHERWSELLERLTFQRLLRDGEFVEIGSRAMKSLSGTNLLFSFESMALRDAVRSTPGAKMFAEGLHEFLYGRGNTQRRFEEWCDVV